MKMYLISDNIDTQIGMRLVGIDGCVAHDSETITAEIKKAVNDPELGILIFTEKAAAMVKEYLNHLKISRDIANSINNMVQESIGLKL